MTEHVISGVCHVIVDQAGEQQIVAQQVVQEVENVARGPLLVEQQAAEESGPSQSASKSGEIWSTNGPKKKNNKNK